MLLGDSGQIGGEIELFFESEDGASVKWRYAESFANRQKLFAEQLRYARQDVNVAEIESRPPHVRCFDQLRAFRNIRHPQSRFVNAVAKICAKPRFQTGMANDRDVECAGNPDDRYIIVRRADPA